MWHTVPNPNWKYKTFYDHCTSGVGREAYPARCPRCDADWAKRTVIRSPVRTQRTGFQKIAQVLSDGLLRDLAQPPFSTERKLVVFSDSRQDAAKLSAGMRFSHYRDALRQALMKALGHQAAGPPAFAAQCQGQALSPAQQQAAATFQSEHPQDATIIAMAANPATTGLPSGGNCSALGFLDSGLTVFAPTLPRPARRGHVAPGPGCDSRISPASTARCTSA